MFSRELTFSCARASVGEGRHRLVSALALPDNPQFLASFRMNFMA